MTLAQYTEFIQHVFWAIATTTGCIIIVLAPIAICLILFKLLTID